MVKPLKMLSNKYVPKIEEKIDRMYDVLMND